MKKARSGFAILGLVFIFTAMFATAQCQSTPVSIIREEVRNDCRPLLEPDPFEDFQNFEWDVWAVQNRFALLLIGTLLGSVVAMVADDRFGMLMGSLCLLAVAAAIFAQIAIGASESDSLGLGWAWIPLFGGIILLVVSFFPADRVDSDSQPSSKPPTDTNLMIVYILAMVGFIILVVGGTLAPLYCNNTAGNCGIGGDTALLNDGAFSQSIKIGIQQNVFSIAILVMTCIGVVGTLFNRPFAMMVVGVSIFGFVVGLFLYYWGTFSVVGFKIEHVISWAWIGLFGGPVLLFVAAYMMRGREDETVTP